MSWKGETLDYGSYQTGQSSPQLSGRQQSVYQPEQMSSNSVNANQYDANAYSSSSQGFQTGFKPLKKITRTKSFTDASIQSSPTHLTYPPSHGVSSSLQPSISAMSRLRAASSAYPPGLDIRAQYRTMPTQNHSPHGVTPRSSSFAHAFTGGYASAPLAAPVDFSLPRTPIDGPRDFNIPQLSAPITAPQDFSSAYHSNLSPVRASQHDRDFGQGQNNDDHAVHDQQQHVRSNEEASSYLRYETGKRKRSFTTFDSP